MLDGPHIVGGKCDSLVMDDEIVEKQVFKLFFEENEYMVKYAKI